MYLQVHRQYSSVLDEDRKLKEAESVLLASINAREERVKELEDKIVKLQKDREEKSKELVSSLHTETLDKAIQTHSIDTHVSSHMQ